MIAAVTRHAPLRRLDEGEHPRLGKTRSLVLDHLLHGTNVENDGSLLQAPYVQLMQELMCRHHHDKASLSAFFVGGGAYTQPRAMWLANVPVDITVAELDPVVTRVARDELFLDDRDMPDTGIVCRQTFEGTPDVLGIRLNWEKRYITLGPVATLLGLAFHLYDPDHLLGETEHIGRFVEVIVTLFEHEPPNCCG